MAGKKKFEPERIAAALKLLRALPVKDNRKTTGETLHMLKGGIREALDKGYDRTEIRALIAPEVPVSATTFNDFLAANLTGDTPQTGKEADAKRKSGKDTTATEPEQTANAPIMKPQSPVATERQPDTPENGGAENVNRETPTTETRANAPAHKTEPRKMPSYYTPDLPDSEL